MTSTFLARTQVERPATRVSARRRERISTGDAARLTRYRGGTYSSTVHTVWFSDGTTARTDLIRLNPNVEAYSLDFDAAAPTRPSHYRAESWSAVPNIRARTHEAEVAWILRNSLPTVGTAELSRRLRAAGYPLGAAHVADHEAIAATQAAIWYFTNDLALDNVPLNEPVSTVRDGDTITFEFEGTPQLGGFTVDVTSGTALSLALQKSVDGVTWRGVAASTLDVTGPGRYRKVLGVGSTMARNRPGRRGLGHRFYRLVILSDDPGRTAVADVGFWLEGSSHYRNADRVVHLYDYLLAGAQWARGNAMAPELSSVRATVEDGRLGPFRLHGGHTAKLTSSSGAVVDATGKSMDECPPAGEFYVRPRPGARTVTVTATVPALGDDAGGRVVTGVAHDDANSRLTPLALAVPAALAVDFHLQW